jgi:outer membrane protein assembly factor BamB/chitodextrinase
MTNLNIQNEFEDTTGVNSQVDPAVPQTTNSTTFSDDFSSGSLDNYVVKGGGPEDWNIETKIDGNSLHVIGNSDVDTYILVDPSMDIWSGEGTIEFDLKIDPSYFNKNAKVAFGPQDDLTGFKIAVQADSILGEDVDLPDDDVFSVRVEVVDDTVTVTLPSHPGIDPVSHTFDSGIESGTIGFGLNTNSNKTGETWFDNVVVNSDEENPPSAEPAAAYDFEGTGSTIIDRSGNGHSGEIHSASRVSDRGGTVLSFDASNNEYAEVGTDDTLDPGTGPYSMSVWFKSDGVSGGNERILSKRGSDNTQVSFLIRDDGTGEGQPQFSLQEVSGAGGSYVRADGTYTDGAWHHAVMVWDSVNDTLELYLDGQKVGEKTDNQDIVDPGGPIYLGGQPEYPNPRYFTGQVDDLKVFRSVVRPNDVGDDTNVFDADFTTDTLTTNPGDTVTFDASNSSGDIQSYDWTFGDGTSETGTVVTHSYDGPGDYTVELTVSNSNKTDSISTEIAVVSENSATFSFNPSTPVVGEPVTFEGTGASTYNWDFEDGTTATGQQVSHTFVNSGSYNITLTTDIGSVTREVSIVDSNFQINGISRDAGGVPFESVSYEDTFNATVVAETGINRVEFELGGTTKVDNGGSNGWSATFDLGALSGTDVLTVTAVDTQGNRVTTQQIVPIQPIPDWVQWIVDQGTVSVDEEHTRIDVKYAPFNLETYSFELGSIPIDVDPPSFDGAPNAVVGYDARQQAAVVEGEGALSTNLFGYGFNAELEVQGTVDKELQLVSASGEIALSIAFQVGPPLYIDLPNAVPCLGDQIGIETTVAPGLALQGNFNGDFEFQDGTVTPGVDLTVGAQLAICGAGAGAEVTGGLDASFDIGTSDYNLRGTVSGSGTAWFDVSVFTAEVTIGFEQQLPASTSGTAIRTSVEDVEWRFAPKRGTKPVPSIPSVDATGTQSPTTLATQTLHPAGVTATSSNYHRLTDRTLEDTQPAIATTGTETVVVWSRQHPDKAVSDGRDIAVRTNDGSGWSTTTLITDDLRSDEAPAIAAASGGNLLVAWERVTTEITDSTAAADIHPHVEIAYSIYDGSSWSSPTVVTDSSDREFQPTVAPDGDGWLLAWEADADLSTGERDVRHVHINPDGTTGSIQRIAGAAYPATGTHTDTGAVLGYATLSSGSPDGVVWKRIDGATVQASQQFSASDVRAVATGQDRVVWQHGPVDQPQLNEGDVGSGSATQLTIRDEVDAIAEPDLATRGGDAVLAYRAYVDNEESRELVYRLDRGSGWIFDRQFVQPPAGDQSAWQPAVTFPSGSETFKTAFTMSETTQQGNNDVFVADRDFLPDYAIRATGPSGTAAGDQVTLDYTVKNRGDIDGTENVELTVQNGTGTVATKTLSPLAAGGTTSGNVSVTVDDTGEFSLGVQTVETTMAGVKTTGAFDGGATTVTVATPSLSVQSIDTQAADTVAITVENTGGAAAFDVPIAVSDGNSELVRTTIDRVDIGGTATTTVTIDPANIDRGSEDRVILDPDENRPDSVSPTARTTPTWLLQPDLVVTDEIQYESTVSGGLVANVLVGNESPVRGSGTLQALASDGTIVGETSVDIAGAGADGTPYETVTVSLDGTTVTAGDPLEFTVDTTVSDADASTNVTTDEVGPIFPEPASLAQEWAFDFDAGERAQHASPAVDGTRVYVGGLGQQFYSLARGAQQTQQGWVELREGELSDSSPAIADGLVFVGSGGGVLYAFDPDASADQRVAWSYRTDSAITSSPVVHNGTVYVGANDGSVHAVSTDGSEAWSTPVDVGGPVFSSLDAANGRVFVTTDDGRVVAVDAAMGDQQWVSDTGADLGASGPRVANGTVYVGADRVYALDAASGDEVWAEPFDYGGTAGSTPAVRNGRVYVGSADGTMYALDAADGSEVWRHEADGGIATDPAVADGRVVFATLAGTVYLLDDESGLQYATDTVEGTIRSSPTMDSFNIFIGTDGGKVLDFSIDSGL